MDTFKRDAYPAGEIRLKGCLRLGFESHEFIPHGSEEGWWCWLTPKAEREILEQYGEPAEVVFGWRNAENEVEVEGELSPDGHYGHMSIWRREIRIHKLRVISLTDEAES